MATHGPALEGATLSTATPSVFPAGKGRVTALIEDEYDDNVRPLPSTEPSPGARPERLASAAPRRPARVPADQVPVPARRSAQALVVMALEVVDRKRAPNNMRGAFPDHLVEMLRSLARTGVPGRQLGPARIHRLHVHPAGVSSTGTAGTAGAAGGVGATGSTGTTGTTGTAGHSSARAAGGAAGSAAGAAGTAGTAGSAAGDTGGETTDYEVCATYTRGPRLFAVAARIRVSPTGASCIALRLV